MAWLWQTGRPCIHCRGRRGRRGRTVRTQDSGLRTVERLTLAAAELSNTEPRGHRARHPRSPEPATETARDSRRTTTRAGEQPEKGTSGLRNAPARQQPIRCGLADCLRTSLYSVRVLRTVHPVPTDSTGAARWTLSGCRPLASPSSPVQSSTVQQVRTPYSRLPLDYCAWYGTSTSQQ